MDHVRNIVIVGAGTAAWLAAAALGRLLSPSIYRIQVVDPAQPDAGPFSEVALPTFHRLNRLLGINEEDLLQRTHGTFTLGGQFAGWGAPGDRYFHGFGSLGAKLAAVPFHHCWLKLRRLGQGAELEEYSTAAVAAKQSRFARPLADGGSVLSLYSYGYHFHAASLAAYLQAYAQAHAVLHCDRAVAQVQLRGDDGFVEALVMDDGTRISADLYIDCTGAHGTLARRALKTGFEDWSRWLPCDRFVGVPCAAQGDTAPYSESVAERAGWRQRIPLQHCTDNGFAYSSRHAGDDEAVGSLLAGLSGEAIGEPRLIRLAPGRPAQFWVKNCISLTGSSLEPLEHTSLHLVQTGITRLITLFPISRYSPPDIEEYNRLTVMEHERIRDFLILHYKCTQRRDSPFWEQCGDMQVPNGLRLKMELFRRCGRIAMQEEEHFGEDSWLSVLLGQNIDPMDYDPLADILDAGEVNAALSHMRSLIAAGVATLPLHARYIERHCAAGPAKAAP